MEKYFEDACLDLIVREHVYNCSRIYSKQLYRTCGCEHMYTVQYILYMGESTGWEETGMAEMSSWDQANRRQKLGFGLEK
jgi:hypothetical protein